MKKNFFLALSLLVFSFSWAYANDLNIDGEYVIALDNGKVLDADAGNVNNDGCKVQIWDYVANRPNQKWKVQYCKGAYTISCSASSTEKSLAIESAKRPTDDALVVLARRSCDKGQWFTLIPVGNMTGRGQGYVISQADVSLNRILTVRNAGRSYNGAPLIESSATAPYSSTAIWYFRKADKAGIKVTLKGMSLANIHNGDCTRAWGAVRAELWTMNGDGSSPVKINDPDLGDGVLMNWRHDRGAVSQPTKPITNYATLTDYTTINNVNTFFTVHVPSILMAEYTGMTPDNQIRQRTVVLKIFATVGSSHKSCDLCTDYTPNAGMREEQVRTIFLRSAVQNKRNGNFVRKDGPAVVGPFDSPFRNDHFYRLHFDVERTY
jgi:Ricin-type beta-trefoil lectin domain-like